MHTLYKLSGWSKFVVIGHIFDVISEQIKNALLVFCFFRSVTFGSDIFSIDLIDLSQYISLTFELRLQGLEFYISQVTDQDNMGTDTWILISSPCDKTNICVFLLVC